MTVITGMSGSGKSSLAFDTLYTEGQRRYIDTFGTYARGFLGGGMERPDVEEIRGLGPVVSIEQKTTNRNPRSTVGTVTDIYDFFRLLYARVATAYSWVSGEEMIKYTEEQIVDLCLEQFKDRRILILSPIVRDRKGHYKDLFERLRKKGYLTVRVDGELREIKLGMKLDRYRQHSIEVQIDKLKIRGEADKERLASTITLALKEGDGLLMVLDIDSNKIRYYSRSLMCPTSGIAYKEPAPHNFSFNSPQGWCPRCKGLGEVVVADRTKLIDPNLSINQGGIKLIGKGKQSFVFYLLNELCEKYKTDLDTPMKDLPAEMIDEILNGTEEYHNLTGNPTSPLEELPGLVKMIEDKLANGSTSVKMKRTLEEYLRTETCPHCHGMRLNQEALQFRIAGKNIGQINHLSIDELVEWTDSLSEKLNERQSKIATEIIKEIRGRLSFLQDVGLGYLSLDRASATLSGGESQRIRLATQIGTQLVEVVYILDEPSIGLHQRDNDRLIHSLEKLRDIGNTVIVVEHDREMMEHADHLIDMGPGAGRKGGYVVFEGEPKNIYDTKSLTADYLSGRKEINLPKERRKGNGKELILCGAQGNNLKNIDVRFPLGTFICVTGVSGSGKSTLINDTLYPILSRNLYNSLQIPLKYKELKGMENIDKVIAVDQSPIGKTPRSNPATYSGVFTDIRNLFEATPESRARGYKIGRFSFNVAGGRCEECKGNGYKTIEMNFLPDVLAPCQSCGGKRYNRETLEIRYKGKSIADVLDMTINRAIEFFQQVPPIKRKLKAMQDVGLGYIKLGQPSATLSGGESQRMKLASELSKKDTGKTMYILDEPTTGLHFEDIRVLLDSLQLLVDRGNTVIVIEHNLDVIKCADFIIDIGPEGGKNGGELVADGTPEDICESKKSRTAPYLKEELQRTKQNMS